MTTIADLAPFIALFAFACVAIGYRLGKYRGSREGFQAGCAFGANRERNRNNPN